MIRFRAVFMTITFDIPTKAVPKKISNPNSISINPKIKKIVDKIEQLKPMLIIVLIPLYTKAFFRSSEEMKAPKYSTTMADKYLN